MASSVYYRFKSQKEPSRIPFDGTGISVFELKKAIIETSNLGDGTDFELTLSSSDGNEVYDDDTEIIPRSTAVIAKRQPAARPGRGGASRYVSGKPPRSSKNAARVEGAVAKSDTRNNLDAFAAASAISELQSEKQREEAVLKLGADMWKHQQKEMAAAAPVRTAHRPKTAGSDNPPPEWYICNRCGIKGHWIKDCPQNGNPDFDDSRRIKKSIGIPRSRLEIIDRRTIVGSDGNVDNSKLPPGAMIDGDGNYVIVKPDKAAWNKFQEKANKSAAAQEEEARGSRELQQKGLECPIDKQLFVDPTKTPCCQTTYCNECIINALLDEDLRCPNCGKNGVLIDDLEPDLEMTSKIQQFKDERVRAEKRSLDGHVSGDEPSSEYTQSTSIPLPQIDLGTEAQFSDKKAPPEGASFSPQKDAGRSTASDTLSKKRKAESTLTNDRKSPAVQPAAAHINSAQTDQDQLDGKPFPKEPPRGPKALMEKFNGAQPPVMSQEPSFPRDPSTSMGAMMGMMPMMWDPMAMMNPFGAMNPMFTSPFPQGSMNASHDQNHNQNQQQNQWQPGPPYGGGTQGNRQNFRGSRGQPYRKFNASRPNPEETAYFRAPVNPHRHQSRRNAPRPTDYREI